MQNRGGETDSVWTEEQDTTRYAALDGGLRSEVCVVGAGFAGLSTAYLLALEGKSVVVLEAGLVGHGETSRTSAHLSNALDDRYYEIERLFGRDYSARAQQSHCGAIHC